MLGIPLLINLFISLSELKIFTKKSQIKVDTCKFKVDQTTYSKRSLEQWMDNGKNKYLVYS